MSIKVVQGIIGESRKDPAQTSQAIKQSSQIAQSTAVSSQAAKLVSTDAVNFSLRSTRTSSPPEKIKEFNEARDVSDKVAEKIKSNEEGAAGAHTGLSEARGQPHLA